MNTSLRKVLNLTFAWLVDLIGGTETWEREYAEIFDPNRDEDGYTVVDAPLEGGFQIEAG